MAFFQNGVRRCRLMPCLSRKKCSLETLYHLSCKPINFNYLSVIDLLTPVRDQRQPQPSTGAKEWTIMLERGAKAPSFTLPTDAGSFNLADHHGKKMVVFFFPRADTSGCTREAIAFSALQDEFDAANCGVIGISKDTPAKQAKFRAKHGLTCLLGADDTTDICEQFGVWVEKSMYGKAYMGIQRASFVIDEQRMIAAVWPKVKVPGHAEEVLAFVTSE
jgi:peroxiredoxin Q/BCP